MALILPFLPLLVRDLGVADPRAVARWSGAIFAAPFLFAALMTPVWGWIGDRSGRKLMVIRALAGLSLALFLMAFAKSPEQLLVLRVLQGLVSGFIPAAIALVSSTAPRGELGYALGTLSSAQAGGIVAGPLLGGFLADLLGFRALFFLIAGIELLAAVAVAWLVRESPRPAGPRPPSLLANARLAARHPLPVALAGLFLTQLAILLVQPFFALFVESLGVGAGRLSSTTGVLFGVTGLATLLAAPHWGRAGDRFGRRRTLGWALAGGCVVFLMQGLAQDVRWLFVLRLLQGLCAAGMLPALYATLAHHTPETQRAGLVAFGSSATLLGGLVAPVLGGALAAQLGMRPVFFIATAFFALNALNVMRLPPDQEPRPPVPRRSWELPTQ
jgi:DHA1 family multidrug resistance protein-like MFS transporter